MRQKPILLPGGHRCAKLYLEQLHRDNSHCGVLTGLTMSRAKYWIPRARRTLKSIVNGCQRCRAYHLRSAAQTEGCPPSWRVTKSAPFRFVGTDVCGPFHIKGPNEGNSKIYLCIFTCAATRALHLEVLRNLETQEFFRAFKRFVSRRGTPELMYSDNFRSYKRAAADLEGIAQLLQDNSLVEGLAHRGIKWHFSTEHAPWENGFVERVVGTVKSALRKVLGKSTVDFVEFETICCEVEDLINRRPLLQVNDEGEEIDVLTPQHFLLQEIAPPLQDSHLPPPQRRDELLRRWRARKVLVEKVWTRWEKEYLGLLRSLHQRDLRAARPLVVGAVVLLGDQKIPKMYWKLARITKTNVGRDGLVRSCIVMLPGGKQLQRPAQLLYPLEICT